MGYNDGVFSLFNQSVTVSNRYADLQAPTFSPPSGGRYQSIYAKSIAPTILSSASGSISSAYAQQIAGSITVNSAITVAYGLNITGPLVQGGTVSNGYSLYALAPVMTTGTIINPIGAFFGLPTVGVNSGGVGIGTTTPMNALDVAGGMAVGSYAGSQGVNSGALAVSGSFTTTQGMGIGTSNPQYYFDVQGTIQAGSAYGWMPQGGQQRTYLSESTSGFGMLNPGTNQFVCANTITLFDFATINSLLIGFNVARFDGRYIYYLPRFNSTLAFFGIIIRYDTTLPFEASTSYSTYDLQANVNPNCTDLTGAAFNGRYLYCTCRYGFGLAQLTVIVRYDTTLPFNSSASYAVFNTATVNTVAGGYSGTMFDGKYVYFTSGSDYSSVWGRYDTTALFSATQSWSFFDLSTVVPSATASARVLVGTFDGRYLYLNPNGSASVSSSFLTRYDTTLPFSVSTSYQTFNVFQLPGNITSLYSGGVFDGRYYYLSPQLLTNGLFSAQMLRYDTTLSFTTTASYSIFNSGGINTIAVGMQASIYDGRYVYYTSAVFPQIFGLIITYDTTQPWGMTTSYSVLDFSTLNTASTGYTPGVYDGTYVYWTPNYYSVVARTVGYPNVPTSQMSLSSQALNGFTLGNGIIGAQTSGTALAGTFTIPSLPAGYIVCTGIRGGTVKVPFF